MDDLSKILLMLLFIASGLVIFVTMFICYATMYKNTKDNKRFVFQNFMPYLSSDVFNETGNKARVTYNKMYFSFIVWGLLLYGTYTYLK